MKKIFSLLVMAVLGISTVSACVKKTDSQGDVTVIVTDTFQALLPNAEVKIGKQVFTTSWDGRVVLKAEQVEDNRTAVISCRGFETKKIKLNAFQIVCLKRTNSGKGQPKEISVTSGGHRMEYRMLTKEAVEADGMIEKSMAAPMVMGVVDEPRPGKHSVPTAPSNVSAGKLTAGEVNDFAKWNFWQTVIGETHREFISDWRLKPQRRYTVQVVNESGYPVVNEPVSLTDRNGNTLFQAVTDNTGKAELWAELITGTQQVSEGLQLSVGEQILAAAENVKVVVNEPCEQVSDVDVMFVFDATGSMGDELHYLQAEMKDVITRASAATGGLSIRTGAVVYRDHEDEYVTRLSRLTSKLATTQTFIDKQSAGGGGDYEEAVPEALMAALNSGGWNENARARIAFLVLDAPCHQDSATLALLHEQILNAAAMGVRLVPVVCSGINKSSEFLLRAMALATNGTSFFLTDDSGIGNSHLKPTTDSLKVEHLNDMLVRTIVEFSYMPSCELSDNSLQDADLDGQFIPNPFSVKELESDPSIPHGEGVHYLIDVSGKLLGVYEGDVPTDHLPIGIYFIKSFYEGTWHTQKILVK